MTVFGIDVGWTDARIAWPARGAAAAGWAEVPAAVRFAGAESALAGEPALAEPPGGAGTFLPSVRAVLARSGDADGDIQAFGRTHSPEAVAALVLAELAERARAATGAAVREVVLATSSEFGAGPGRALRRAAEQAGLSVKDTVLAPVAVCLHYDAVGEGIGQNLVVCDIGATGAEISALQVREQLVDVVRVPYNSVSGSLQDTDPQAWAADLREAVRTVGSAIGGAALEDLDAILLAGDRATPGVAEMLHEALGVQVRRSDPETAVAAGAARSAHFGFLMVNMLGAPSAERRRPEPMRPEPRRPVPEVVEDPEPRGRVVDVVDPVEDPEPPVRPQRRPHPEPPGPQQGPQPDPLDGPAGPTGPAEPAGPTEPIAIFEQPEHVPPRRAPAPAGDGTTHPEPVAELTAVRRGDDALLTWVWPQDCVTTTVRWQLGRSDTARTGETTCLRRVYEHEGGFRLRVGREPSLFTVEALVPGSDPHPGRPSSVGLAGVGPIVRYAPAVPRGRRRIGRVTLSSDDDCVFPAIEVVLTEDRYPPRGAHEGQIVHRIPGARLTSRTPLIVEFPLPRFRKPAWLVCFLADPAESGVELLPESLHRLKVG